MLHNELKKIDLSLYRDNILKFSDIIHIIAKDYPIFKKYIKKDIKFNRVVKKTKKLRKFIKLDIRKPKNEYDLASYIIFNYSINPEYDILVNYIIALKCIENIKYKKFVPDHWINISYKFFPKTLENIFKNFGVFKSKKIRAKGKYETIYLDNWLPYFWFSYLSQYYPNLYDVMEKVKKETPWLTEEKKEFWEVVRRRCFEIYKSSL